MTPRDDLDQFATMLNRGVREYAPRSEEADPELVARKRRGRRRGLIAWGVVLLVVGAAVATYIPVTLNAPIGAARVHLDAPAATPVAPTGLALPKEGESLISIIGTGSFESVAGTKEILASAGGTAALPMASISKLITAMVVLKAKPLAPGQSGPTITFTKADADLYDKYYLLDATVTSMRTGASMTESDALKTMLIASAANYADVLSTWAYGSPGAFLSAARQWMAANGLKDTKMVEPTGIDAHNVSTPADLVALGKIVMADPVLAPIVGQGVANVGSIGTISGTNDLLGAVPGVNGIKTGTLGGSDLLFSQTATVANGSIPISVIGVVLNGASRGTVDEDVKALLASVASSFQLTDAVKQGVPFGTYSTPWGDKATVVTGTNARFVTFGSPKITMKVVTTPIASARDGATVGSVTYTAGSTTQKAPLVLKGAITPPSAWWRLTHPQQVFG